MTATISVILNLIQNQLDPDFRQDDGYGNDPIHQLADKNKAKKLLTFNLQFWILTFELFLRHLSVQFVFIRLIRVFFSNSGFFGLH